MAVRVKVKKCELNAPSEWRKFSIDPEITTLEVLYSLLAKAFEINTDFAIKYKAYDPAGNEIYLAVLSDWDLDAAFLRIHNVAIQTASEPCLTLQIDIKPFTEVKDWDGDAPTVRSGSAGVGGGNGSSNALSPSYPGARELIQPLQQSIGASQKYVQHMQTKLPGLIMNQMEKTFSMVQKAFNLSEETMASLPPRAPLADHEFRLFLDALGQIQRSDELRKVIFFGGIDPSLRRVVWKHILNVYPGCMNGHQRMDFMRRKSEHYYRLRETWKAAIKQGCVAGELAYVTSMVKKDVLRTDRLHPFYAGSDDNQNIAALFNILTTYALNHPSVSYCQGMSDLASPLLVCMQDEAQAYICFCAIMSRVRGNFLLDGIAMTQKFAHLTEALSFYDPEFWEYLKSQQADDLLFCYRWLLLELKREFPFEDALRMLEVQWSSLKYEAIAVTQRELCLYEREFVPPLVEVTAASTSGPPISPSFLAVKQRENAYTKVCALRRQSSSASLSSLSSTIGSTPVSASKLDSTRRLNQSLDDNMSQHAARRHRHSSASSLKAAHQSLDESKMLMLMESANESAADGTKPTVAAATVANELTEIEDNDDDDVFMHNANNGGSGTCVAEQFDFHPTNPFKEDAQLYASRQTTPTHLDKPSRPPAKAFLSSSTSSSLTEDDVAAATGTTTDGEGDGKSVGAKSHAKNVLGQYGAVSNKLAKQMAASTVAVAAGGVASGKGHFKELKERIAATSLSFDDGGNGSNGGGEKTQVKLVKNFNEFLNFAAANKNRLADKIGGNISTSVVASAVTATTTTTTSTVNSSAAVSGTKQSTAEHPLLQFTKGGLCSSQEESESSSSVPETTWSCSTTAAATAIQQLNNLSNNSLHLELASLSSTTAHTPEPTATPTVLTHDIERITPEDCSQDQEGYYPMSTAMTRELRLEAENLDRQLYGECKAATAAALAGAACSGRRTTDIVYEQLDKDSLDLVEDLKENEIIACPDVSELLVRRRERDAKARSSGGEPLDGNLNLEKPLDAVKLNPFLDESFLPLPPDEVTPLPPSLPTSSSLPEVLVPVGVDAAAAPHYELASSAADEFAYTKAVTPQRRHTDVGCNGGSEPVMSVGTNTAATLPPPMEFGGGNPFLMFLCLTLLLQHRNTIMKSAMDYNEIAMHFDKMVRKHDVTRVLNQARSMYIDYLKLHNAHKRQQQQQQLNANANSHNNNTNHSGSDINRNNAKLGLTANSTTITATSAKPTTATQL